MMMTVMVMTTADGDDDDHHAISYMAMRMSRPRIMPYHDDESCLAVLC